MLAQNWMLLLEVKELNGMDYDIFRTDNLSQRVLDGYIREAEIAAKGKEDRKAMVLLGRIYSEISNGMVKRNLYEAEKWFKRAAFLGSTEAMRKLGDMYFFGEIGFCHPEEAVIWYRMAAEQDDAEACYKLGLLYRDGRIVRASKDMWLHWMGRAYELGLEKAKENIKLGYSNEERIKNCNIFARKHFVGYKQLPSPDGSASFVAIMKDDAENEQT